MQAAAAKLATSNRTRVASKGMSIAVYLCDPLVASELRSTERPSFSPKVNHKSLTDLF
jgi:butyrate kinase